MKRIAILFLLITANYAAAEGQLFGEGYVSRDIAKLLKENYIIGNSSEGYLATLDNVDNVDNLDN